MSENYGERITNLERGKAPGCLVSFVVVWLLMITFYLFDRGGLGQWLKDLTKDQTTSKPPAMSEPSK